MTKNKYQQKHIIRLSKRERQQLVRLTSAGSAKARVIKRAAILLKADAGLKDAEIALQVAVSIPTIERVRKWYDTEGLEQALYDAPRSGQPPTITDAAEATLVAIACSDPPEGASTWTLQLLQRRLLKDKVVKHVSTVAIWQHLTSRGIKPWREKNVVHPESHS